MGLTRREAIRRLDAAIDFAELEDFVDLKLKNYSSGMMVRLAFALTVQADADIMLIDEVLAVGDAAFAQKCMDVFHDRRAAGKTVVLVTHDMGTAQSICHRALLLHDGELQYAGDPEEAAMRYYRLNFAVPVESEAGKPEPEREPVLAVNARVVDAGLLDESGTRIDNLEQDSPIVLDILLEAARDLERPLFVLHVMNAEGVVVSGLVRTLDGPVATGGRVRLTGQIENRLVAGRYYLDCWIRQDERQGTMAVQALRVLQFVVYGTAPRHGVVALRSDVQAVPEP
jgi:hypothetical protein